MFDIPIAEIPLPDYPDPDTIPAAYRTDAARRLHRFEAMISARKLAYAASLFAYYRASENAEDRHYSRLDAIDLAEAELSAGLGISSWNASVYINVGMALRDRLPNVAAAHAAGDLDYSQVRIITDDTVNVAAESIKEVESRILAEILQAAPALTGKRLRAAIAAAVIAVDPDGVRRRAQARKDRHVGVETAADGMAQLYGLLPAEDAIFMTNRLGEMAKRVCTDDPRTFHQRRADALVALVHGKADLDCQCGVPECPFAFGVAGVARRPLVHVITTAGTFDGNLREPRMGRRLWRHQRRAPALDRRRRRSPTAHPARRCRRPVPPVPGTRRLDPRLRRWMYLPRLRLAGLGIGRGPLRTL